MTTIALGSTVKITVTFRDWLVDTEAGEPVDPDTVEGSIYDSSNVLVSSFSPNNPSVGTYTYLWTPTTAGTFIVEMLGTFSDGTTDAVSDEFIVSTTFTGGSTTTKTLGEEQVLSFTGVVTPAHLDPEELLAIYPDASPIEVLEFIHYYSSEVEYILGGATPVAPVHITATGYDYIRASSLCALSKIYELADGEMTVTLGDLTVVTQRFSKRVLNRGNATTWCELAAVLRRELFTSSGTIGMKSILKGSNYPNPIPVRHIRDKEHGRFTQNPRNHPA